MRTLIAYFSRFGNTKRVAQAIAETLKPAGDIRATSIDQLTASDFAGVDLVVMGSPTHAFSVPEAVRTVLVALPPGILAGKSVAAFDTTVKVWPLRRMRASPKVLRQLCRLGGKPVAQPETFFIRTSSTQQPGEVNLLLEGEIGRTQEWANQMLRQLQA